MIRNKSKLIILIIILIIVIAATTLYFTVFKEEKIQPAVPPVNNPSTGQIKESQTAVFDKTKYSIDTPGSLWLIVNKKRPLDPNYVPSLNSIEGANLQPEAAEALQKLLHEAAQEQVSLKVISGYRSYASQQSVYNNYVAADGQAQADTYSARPGYSEHQTGLAADMGNDDGKCDLDICFESTPGGKWLAEHANDFGFIIRYEQNKIAQTGYQYEPWHLRYVGQDLAKELKGTGQTMEEFFGLPAATSY